MVDARIQFELEQPEILSTLTRGIDLAQTIRNAPILDRLLKQREAQGQQTFTQGEQAIQEGERQESQALVNFRARVGVALLGANDNEARVAILTEAKPTLISLGEDSQEVDNFPIDDDELIRGIVDLAGPSQDVPADQRSFESLIAQMSPADQTKARKIKAGLAPRTLQDQIIKIGDVPHRFDRTTNTFKQVPVSETGEPVTAATVGEAKGTIAAAQVTAKGEAEKALRKTADAENRVRRFDNDVFKAQNGLDVANEAAEAVSGLTAGAIGAMSSALPGTDAFALNGLIDTLLANLSFEELKQMREASTTGGALGAINTRELQLLGATLTSLAQGLPPAQLRKNLKKVATSYQRILDNLSKMREADVKTLGTDPSVIRFDDQGNIVQ